MLWWPQVTAILLVVVELCWILPWYRAVIQISHVASLPRAGLVLGGIMLTGYAVALALESMRIFKNIQFIILGVLLLVCLILAENLLLLRPPLMVINGLVNLDPGAVLVLFFVLWLWWRGLTLGREAIRPMTAWRRFELGLLLFIGYLFMVNQFTQDSPGLFWYIFFLFAGFLSVIIARVSYVGIHKGINKNPFDRRWFLGTLGVLGSAVVISAVFGSLLTGQYQLILNMLAEGVKLLVAVALFIVALPALALSQFMGPLIPLLRKLLAAPTITSEQTPLAYLPPAIYETQKPIPPWLQAVIFWAIVLLIVILLILRARRAFNKSQTRNAGELESLLQEGDARRLLRKALQDALDGWAARLRPAQRLLAAARVRRIYAQLMELCKDLNMPRPPSKTPLEFLPIMGELFAAVNADLALITQAYVRVRYGEYPEIPEEVDEIEKSWQRISQEGQRLKRAGWGKLKTAEVKEVQRTGV